MTGNKFAGNASPVLVYSVLNNPKTISLLNSDDCGEDSTFLIAQPAVGRLIHFQAAELTSCRLSNLVSVLFL